MGNAALSVEKRLVIHSELTQEYKDVSFSVISDCYETLIETYGSGMLTKFTLKSDEFDAVFGLAFADPVEHFEEIWDDGEEASVFQVFCALFLLCRQEFHTELDGKVEAVFRLFDFDGSGALNKIELECLLQACAAGLARATGTPRPVQDDDASFGRMACEVLSVEGSCEEKTEASVGMLKAWLRSRRDVLAYLSEFLEARMVVDYQRRVEALFEATTQRFIERAGGYSRVISTHDLEAMVRDLPGSPPTAAEIKAFVDLLDRGEQGGGGVVGFDEFADAILPWISFSIVDDDCTGTLSPDELKLLIWISGGENSPEPTEAVVRAAARAVDADNDGEVVRLEWLKYAGSADPSTGALKFSKAARDLFKKMDTDGSSIVNTRELKDMFKNSLADLVRNLDSDFSQSSITELNALINNAADDVAQLIDVNEDGIISFDEFVKHVDTISHKQDSIRNYAKLLLDNDRLAATTAAAAAAAHAPNAHNNDDTQQHQQQQQQQQGSHRHSSVSGSKKPRCSTILRKARRATRRARILATLRRASNTIAQGGAREPEPPDFAFAAPAELIEPSAEPSPGDM